MDKKYQEEEMNKRVIENYENDEKMMVLIFAQWCINNDLNPADLYKTAYPEQANNKLLEEVMAETVSKDESEEIHDETVINVLQMFGNDDLAFAVQGVLENKNQGKKSPR